MRNRGVATSEVDCRVANCIARIFPSVVSNSVRMEGR